MEESLLELDEKIKRVRSFRTRPDRSTEGLRRVRSFKTTSKGLVNRGDSLTLNRSTVPDSPGLRKKTTEDIFKFKDNDQLTVESLNIPNRVPANADISCVHSYFRVLVTGAEGVGKSSIIDQFMTSEFLGNGSFNICK